jgi:flagellar protein FliJ
MKRTARMGPVRKLLSNGERDRARDLAAAQKKLLAAEERLQELTRYHADYVASFQRRGKEGQNVATLRDFQAFLSRLLVAVSQQEQIVGQARAEMAGFSKQWQRAAQKSKAVENVVERWQGEERRSQDRKEQIETDERAQRTSQGAARAVYGENR